MLIVRKSKNFTVSPTQNSEFDWKATLLVVDVHPRMLFLIEKSIFCGLPTLV